MALSTDNVFREFIIRGAEKIGVIDKLRRFEEYIKSTHSTYIGYDVLIHYVDSVIIPVLEDANHLAIGVDNKAVSRYLRNRFTKALKMNDKGFIRWFLRNYVMSYTDVDAIVSDNMIVLAMFFGFTGSICPITGSSCVSNPAAPCGSVYWLPQTPICCPNYYLTPNPRHFNVVDNAPWVTNYSSGPYGVAYMYSLSQPTITLTGSFTAPSCFPSSGVTLNLDVTQGMYCNDVGSCATSCPSGTICPSGGATTTVNKCPGSTYSDSEAPVFYYNINLTALPNGSYSTWWQMTVS